MHCENKHDSYENRFCSECGMKIDIERNVNNYLQSIDHKIDLKGDISKQIMTFVENIKYPDKLNIVVYDYANIFFKTFEAMKRSFKMPLQLTFDNAIENLEFLTIDFDIMGTDKITILDISKSSDCIRFLNFNNMYLDSNKSINRDTTFYMYKLYKSFNDLDEPNDKDLVKSMIEKLFL